MEPVSETLPRVAASIRRRGWMNAERADAANWEIDPFGGGSGGTGPVCLEGAFADVLGIDLSGSTCMKSTAFLVLRGHPAYVALLDYLDPSETESDVDGSHELWVFNDKLGRSEDEVVGVLLAAGLVAAARESSRELVAA